MSKQSGPSSRLERYERVERWRKRKRDVEAAATLIEMNKYPRQTTDDRELTEPTQSDDEVLQLRQEVRCPVTIKPDSLFTATQASCGLSESRCDGVTRAFNMQLTLPFPRS